jgi:hypothetical protein
MTRFTLPDDAVNAITPLGRLPPSSAKQIAAELDQKLIVSFQYTEDVNRVLEATQAVRLDDAERHGLADAIIGLQYLKIGASAATTESFIKELIDAVSISRVNSLSGDELQTLAENVSILVEPRALRASVKAYQLRADQSNIFLRSQIYTDIRPVFDDDLARPLLASLLTHTIKISYDESGGQQSIFLVADSQDLQQLQDQIARALEKAAALRALIADDADGFGPALDQEDSE